MHSIVRLEHDVIAHAYVWANYAANLFLYSRALVFSRVNRQLSRLTYVRDIERLVVRICYWGRSFLVSDSATILNISTPRGPGGPADHFFSSLYKLKFPLKLQDE